MHLKAHTLNRRNKRSKRLNKSNKSELSTFEQKVLTKNKTHLYSNQYSEEFPNLSTSSLRRGIDRDNNVASTPDCGCLKFESRWNFSNRRQLGEFRTIHDSISANTDARLNCRISGIFLENKNDGIPSIHSELTVLFTLAQTGSLLNRCSLVSAACATQSCSARKSR